MMYTVDGHDYENFSDIPDIGSFECTEVKEKNVRGYIGLSADVTKLPTRAVYPEYKDLGNGSTAYCVDTGDLYMYEKTTDQWYQQ